MNSLYASILMLCALIVFFPFLDFKINNCYTHQNTESDNTSNDDVFE